MIKKIFIIIMFINIQIILSKELAVGPATTKNMPKVCKKACSKEKLHWTGKTTCEFLNLADEYNCRCECKNGKK